MARINASSLALNATCVGRVGSGIVASGCSDFVFFFSPSPGASMAFRIDSVVATTSASGPAATARPLLCATAKREQVGEGRASSGQGVGRIRMLQSPEIPLKPIS